MGSSSLWRLTAYFLVVASLVAGAAWFLIGRGGLRRTRTTSAAAHRNDAQEQAARAEFGLPGEGPDAAMILGSGREQVRVLLGSPSIAAESADVFQGPPILEVHYRDDRASSLIVSAPNIARHERYARRWLHLPGDGPLMLGRTPLHLALFVGDDDRLGVEFVPPVVAPASPEHPAAAPPAAAPAKVTLDTLLRAFPSLPERAKARCRTQGRPGARSLVCTGFEAGISYEIDDAENPRSLTVLDPPGARDQAQCRRPLLDGQPGLALASQTHEAPATEKEYFRSNTLEALAIWTPAGGFRKTSRCSLMVCLRGSEHSSCSPR